MKVYVASSWRNVFQPGVVVALRKAGHDVYDFRNPPGRAGFGWEEIHKDWLHWTAAEYIEALQHPLAQAGFKSDFEAMKWAQACVLVLPCGRSAHLEAGWFTGQHKDLVIFTRDGQEPELMYKMANSVVTTMDAVLERLGAWEDARKYPYFGRGKADA